MADRAKVDKGLERCLFGKVPFGCGECPYYGDEVYTDAWSCRLSLMRDADELLKEQQETIEGLGVLQKVMETVEPVPDYNVRYWRCPKCNWLLTAMVDDQCSIPNRRDNYCSSCGRPLKWQ